MSNQDAAVAAIEFALKDEDGMAFLNRWNEGEFDVLRKEWPEAPEAVYIGADPLHPKTKEMQAAKDARNSGYTEGDVHGPNECSMYTVCIDLPGHCAAIEIHGSSMTEAKSRRADVLNALGVEST